MKQSPRDMFNIQGPRIELVNEHCMRHRSARAAAILREQYDSPEVRR